MSTVKEETRTPKAPKEEPTPAQAPQEPVREEEPRRGALATVPMFASPLALMNRYAEELDRIFEDFGLEFGLRMPSVLTRGPELLRREAGPIPTEWSPRIDILRHDGQMIVRADLPGLTRDEVTVEVTDEALTIRGEMKREKEEQREGYVYRERRTGSFFRTIPLPEGVEVARATAEFHNGVLEVVIPAPSGPERPARRLEIQETK